MKPSENAYNLIKKFEGLRLKAYKALPTEKYYTIGYGTYGPQIKKGMIITEEQADAMLRKSVEEISSVIDSDRLNLEQNQYDALVSFIYNIGTGAYKRSTLRKKLIWLSVTPKYSEYINMTLDCVKQIKRWDKSGGKVIPGLTKRREEEARLFLAHKIS